MVGGAEEAFTLLGMPRTARYAHRTRQMEAAADTEGMGGHCSSHILRQDQGFVCLQLGKIAQNSLPPQPPTLSIPPTPSRNQLANSNSNATPTLFPIPIFNRLEL